MLDQILKTQLPGAKKVACHALHLLTTEAGKAEKFGPYTDTSAGATCPCWFDLTRSDCACCTSEGVQCGAPMHQWCTSRWPQGPSRQHTLQGRGPPEGMSRGSTAPLDPLQYWLSVLLQHH